MFFKLVQENATSYRKHELPLRYSSEAKPVPVLQRRVSVTANEWDCLTDAHEVRRAKKVEQGLGEEKA